MTPTMPRARAVLACLLLACGALVASCGGDGPSEPPAPPEPISGYLTVELASPEAGDRGILVELRGPEIDSLRSTAFELFHAGSSTRQRVLLAGSVGTGPIFEFWVPDVERIDDYTAILEQVAGGTAFEQRDTAGYTLTVR